MSNRRFNLENTVLPEATSKLLYISSAKYGDDWVSLPHSHYFTEIFYIKEGCGYMKIESETIPIQKDSLILIGTHVQHTEVSDSSHPLDYYVIGVEGLKINTSRRVEYSVVNGASHSANIRQCFENILQEMNHKQENYAEICQFYLAILILLICRKDHVSYEFVEHLPKKNSNRECYNARRYLETNFHNKITLDSLAENCNLNKYYLSHKFKELYHLSPMAYLTDVRIAAAKDLLTTSNLSIEEIASTTGFSSSSYFSQAFMKSCNETPQQYRKKNSER